MNAANFIIETFKAQLVQAGGLLVEDAECTPASHIFNLPIADVGDSCLISAVYPGIDDVSIRKTAPLRTELHRMLRLPLDRPMMRPANACPYEVAEEDEGSTAKGGIGGPRLMNPHATLSPSGVEDGKMHLVQDYYDYYHYMQDQFDDKGWGCAYRSLQTICSWYKRQNYTSKKVPTHKEIQQALVDAQDKPQKFIGSKQWIGSFEVSMVLDVLLEVPCNMITCNQGIELEDKGRELRKHFEEVGTPIMMGGGELAFTCIGIDYNESLGQIKFLILDPHYTGKDDLKSIHGRWVGWQDIDFFDKYAFYNLCCPQRIDMI